MSPVRGRCIVLGVTGGIAAYKAAEVCRRLVGAGAHVVPVLTAGALRMVGETTFSALASERAVTSLWNDPSSAVPHTGLGQRADAVVVCPATARLISDLRTGRSGDILTATLLATRAPVIVAPAMHTEMWEQPSVQENMAVLAERGVTVVGPVDGPLAGGDVGSGRMAEPAEIVAAAEAVLTPQDLAGRRVLVTTDPDRAPAVARVVAVETAAEMAAAVELEAPGADAVVMAAAVADFRPANPAGTKFKKGRGVPPLELEPTRDILASLGACKRPGQVLVGFAAETEDLEANALSKLRSKKLDVIVANDVSKEHVGFGHDTNEIVMYTADGARHHVPLTTKQEAARAVLDTVAAVMAEAP